MTNEKLIKLAASIIKSKKLGDYLVGDVGCAVLSEKGKVYMGVCIDTSGIGFCAEHTAIATMVTARETSWTRKGVIAGLTYSVVVLFFFVADLANPFVNAIVPSIGFVLSTLTVPLFKKWWIRRYKN